MLYVLCRCLSVSLNVETMEITKCQIWTMVQRGNSVKWISCNSNLFETAHFLKSTNFLLFFFKSRNILCFWRNFEHFCFNLLFFSSSSFIRIFQKKKKKYVQFVLNDLFWNESTFPKRNWLRFDWVWFEWNIYRCRISHENSVRNANMQCVQWSAEPLWSFFFHFCCI